MLISHSVFYFRSGKTQTAAQMMIKILTASDHRILVCAETNLAVDNLALRFLHEAKENYGPIRLGRQSDEMKEVALEGIILERLVRNRVQHKTRQQFYLTQHKRTVAEIFQESRIVFATCAGAGDPILDGQIFESVIMDEASMSTEPGALCPLVHRCCHLVLIGDHKQLGPHANGGACLSLFERLSRPGACVRANTTFLNEQHRMHPALCAFPSRTFYDGQLVTAAGLAETRKTPNTFFGGSAPVRFVNVSNGREERIQSSSWYNEVEIQRVLDVVGELLRDAELSASQITILTFYRAQQMKLRAALVSSTKAFPLVCSVDEYQGRENEVIIASTVRTGDSLGFCADERRVNVC